MKAYLDVIRKVLAHGVRKANRTGVDAVSLAGAMFEHDMADGFPLLTTKKVPLRLVASELEFFIAGRTDKRWLQGHDNHIWDEWCDPRCVPYGHDEETRVCMREEPSLGPVYGWQWRHFGAVYAGCDKPPDGRGIDQLMALTDKLRSDPDDRRMIVSAWNPKDLASMALPPCHYAFQVTVTNGRLNLLWNQRSVDSAVGLPFNIAGYGLLLHLLARHAGLKEGRLVGFLADTHVYVNHLLGLEEQLSREPYPLPTAVTEGPASLYDWTHGMTRMEGYRHHPKVPFEIAV